MSGVTDFPEEKPRSVARATRGGDGGGDEGGFSLHSLKLPLGPRITKFYHDVVLEMKKVAWPGRSQVWSTTIVVLIAVVFFGFYLFLCDYSFNQLFKFLEKAINKR
ncbi:MAG TPA: preprotein translocase subunit SecE [Blastocatellia bacterium]|nr:preprotein translocase subunit SecE [Blastocatellia bacterium]